ncbi:hypothetical protein Tco_1526474, partial [Tanacetum coccineum]
MQSFTRSLIFSSKVPFIMLSLHITAKVAGKSVSISEASIRSDLLFDDADGIDSLPNQAIFDAIQLMGSNSYKHCHCYKQLANVPVPLDHFHVNALTSKVFSFMVKKGKHFSEKVTPLFASMLVQPTEDEGAPSERPSEAQPTPCPAHTSEVPFEPQTNSSPAHTSEVPFEPQTDLSPAHTSEVPFEPQTDSSPAHTSEDVGRTREIVDEDKEIDENILSTEDVLSTDKEKVSTDRPIVSTDESKVSTDKQIEGTDTEDHTEEGSATQATQTPTSTIFGDDETIAKALLNMSQAKA